MKKNMNHKWFSILNILVIFLVFGKTSFSEGCDSNGFSCISCTDYQVCNAGVPQGRIVSCRNGNSCADDQLIQCQIKLNCYALNECTENGIFPNSMSDSDYFVCLNDGGDGFLKYDFSCQEEHFFDESILNCIPRSATVSSSPTTASDLEDPTTTTESSTSTSSTVDPTLTSTITSTDPTSITSTSTDPTSSTSADPTSSTSADPTSSTSTSTDPTSSTSTSTDPTSSTSTSTYPTSSTSTSTNPTSPSTNPTFPSLPTEPSTPTPIPPFACLGPGVFPNPNNCKMYYRCSTSLKAFYYICPGTSYFNENILKCSLIITPACQEQILKNSNSTVSPSKPSTTTPKPTTSSTISTTSKPTTKPSTTITSTSTTTTTTPIPTTTTTSTSTITASTTASTCSTAGTFENTADCKTYYRCSTSGKIFHYVCPGNTYFNEFTKRCSLTMTPRCKNLIQG